MLEEVYRGYVDAYLAREDQTWRMCCNSDCEPCVLKLGRVVDRVRQLLASDARGASRTPGS